ncbi:MAG: hypothetical protein P4L51_15590 [Puia sp.]|nr:hypothetical protein [Puia sp.]
MFPDISFEKVIRRIENLGTAIFWDFGRSEVKFPTSVVRIRSVNEGGEIWLTLPKPYPDSSGLDRSFPVGLHFYNKKYDYYVQVDGVGELITDIQKMPAPIEAYFSSLAEDELLIRVKMSRMESFEKRKNEKSAWPFLRGSFYSESNRQYIA